MEERRKRYARRLVTKKKLERRSTGRKSYSSRNDICLLRSHYKKKVEDFEGAVTKHLEEWREQVTSAINDGLAKIDEQVKASQHNAEELKSEAQASIDGQLKELKSEAQASIDGQLKDLNALVQDATNDSKKSIKRKRNSLQKLIISTADTMHKSIPPMMETMVRKEVRKKVRNLTAQVDRMKRILGNDMEETEQQPINVVNVKQEYESNVEGNVEGAERKLAAERAEQDDSDGRDAMEETEQPPIPAVVNVTQEYESNVEGDVEGADRKLAAERAEQDDSDDTHDTDDSHQGR
jgi:hypothetical protein